MEVGESAGGKPISVAGRKFADAIGAHSLSVIEYELPSGATRFQATGALDDAALAHTRGATVKFMVFTNSPMPEIKSQRVPVKLGDLSFHGPVRVPDLWRKSDLGEFSGEFAPELQPHGAGLYRIAVSKEAQATK